MASEAPLRNQLAVVTGGGRGLGRAIALALAGAGARVAVLARSTTDLAETVRLVTDAGGSAHAFVADVTVPEQVSTVFADITAELGPIDLLVNNAGVIKPLGPVWMTSPDEWWQTMEVNVRGPLLCSHAVLPAMVERRRGRIVNMASGAGAASSPNYTSYVTSKTALIRFTECVALETAAYGVTAFSISPGTVRTSMTEYSLNSAEGQRWLPWFLRVFEEQVDMPAERGAQLVVELASGRADALSGRFISVFDDLDFLIRSAAEIEEKNLYSLRLDKLSPGSITPTLAAILASARKGAG